MLRVARTLALVTAALLGLTIHGVSSVAAAPIAVSISVSQDTRDVITMHNGNRIEGEILEETDTLVRIRVTRFGIAAETTYNKGDILSIQRGVPVATPDTPATTPPGASQVREARAGRAPADGDKRVYVIELTGKFGEDITQTPIRDAVRDAQRLGADYLVFVLENEWRRNVLEEIPDDAAEGVFDELFRAEQIHPIFTEEIPQTWDPQPKVIFWVKRAMGGAAFLPLVCRDIYFAPDARMGGIGNLSRLFGSMGDEMVREKQYSLRMGHAEGICIQGGYPVEIVRAMAQIERVYSYRIEGGRAVIVEGWPDPSRGEILLTDDGEGENADTIEQLARGEGNDVLTLNARLAQTLGVSRGTVGSIDELIFALGISRNSVVHRSEGARIMDQWRSSLDNARRELRKLWREYNEIQVGGDYNERTRARGQRRRKLEQMQAIIRRFDEALNYGQLQIPNFTQIQQLIEQIRLEQLADRR